MENNFERALPGGYKLVKHINAKDIKFGVIFNLIAVVICAVVFGIAIIPFLLVTPQYVELESDLWIVLYPFLWIAVMLLYIVSHELVHGAAYKKLTGEKLTFGISWSCAFCGVPKIYTYRRTALIAVLSPFVVFTLLWGILAVVLFFVHPVFYFGAVSLFGIHFGGCAGDLYVTALLLFKYKNPRTLMRDTGPEQFFYIPE